MSETIAVRSPNWLGDAVLSTVIPPALRRGSEITRLDVLTPRGLGDVFLHHPAVDRVVEFERGGEVDAYRRGGYDRAVIAPTSFGTAWRAWRGGVHTRVGYATSGRGALLTRSLPGGEHRRSRHQVENDHALAHAAGGTGEDDPRVVVEEAWDVASAQLWPASGRPRVAIMPGAAFGPAKRWFPERFAEFARALVAEGIDVALVGGPGDRDVIEAILTRAPSCLADLAGRTRVGVLAALLRSASLLVSNDTGPMHLAAAVGTPTLALFGSTNPTWTRPWGEVHRTIVGPAPCAPCYQRSCRFGAPCFEQIAVVDVLRAALEMIRTRL